jgi:hypothetical protein
VFVKYFFLTESWTVGRVWEVGGLWDEVAWRRKPDIQKMGLCIIERGERLWLHRVEDTIIMVEVKPELVANTTGASNIGQVVLKRLMTAEQVLDMMCELETPIPPLSSPSMTNS